jgi:hypothetical protein
MKIYSQDNDSDKFQINEEAKHKLAELAQSIAQENKDQSFIITIEYKGIPSNVNDLRASQKYSEFFQKISAFFTEWSERFDNYHIDDEDIKNLQYGNIELLSDNTKDKFKVFLDTLIKNSLKDNNNNDNDNNKCVAILSEIYE